MTLSGRWWYRMDRRAPSGAVSLDGLAGFLIAESATKPCVFGVKAHGFVALSAILAPSMDGGSLAPTESGRRPPPFAP